MAKTSKAKEMIDGAKNSFFIGKPTYVTTLSTIKVVCTPFQYMSKSQLKLWAEIYGDS